MSIVLTTFNARYSHTSLALRYLLANLGSHAADTEILEFTLDSRPIDAVEQVLASTPKIVGLGVYIWNRPQSEAFAKLLKKVAPDVILVVGGPEVSFAPEDDLLVATADHVIVGEGELAFSRLISAILNGLPTQKRINDPEPQWDDIILPYDSYLASDLDSRTVYIESSRGCPFKCAFCLSADQDGLRMLPLSRLFEALDSLWSRGARSFKFLDRTFNANKEHALEILGYLQNLGPELEAVHLEIAPQMLGVELIQALSVFRPGVVQAEVGIQSLNEEVLERIGRAGKSDRALGALHQLRMKTGVHIHADLIVGLPKESLESFGEGFDRLLRAGPHEIQVGILKRLFGTPLERKATEWKMVFSQDPPYEILSTSDLSFGESMEMRRFARFWDLFANSGHFKLTLPLLLVSPFEDFLQFSGWLHANNVGSSGIALQRRFRLLFGYLAETGRVDPGQMAMQMMGDYLNSGFEDIPKFLRPHLPENMDLPTIRHHLGIIAKPAHSKSHKRQARHSGQGG